MDVKKVGCRNIWEASGKCNKSKEIVESNGRRRGGGGDLDT